MTSLTNEPTASPSMSGQGHSALPSSPALSLAKSLAQSVERRSRREIKRKKFDDELVESSLLKTETRKIRPLTFPGQQEKTESVEKEAPSVPPPEKKKV